MDKNVVPGRSPEANGDQEYDRERCRVLDAAARIVFGVSAMDLQIEEYLARKNSHLRDKEYERYVRKIHKMKFGGLVGEVRRYIKGKDVEALFAEIKEIKRVRNAIAHSTMEVDSGGTVRLGGEYVEAIIGKLKEYSISTLVTSLERTDACNSRLRELFEDSQGPSLGGNGNP